MSRSQSALAMALSLLVLSVCCTSVAGAYATNEPPPTPSTATGLPDGRVYEQVSPANKHGYQAGATAPYAYEPNGVVHVDFSIARADGNAVVYGSSGPAAETNTSGVSETFVAERTASGWKSRSAMPRGINQTEGLPLGYQNPNWLDYSPDLAHVAYAVYSADVKEAPALSYANFYLIGSNPFEEPTWLLREGSSRAVEIVGGEGVSGTQLMGISPDASVVYIAYDGRLLAQDAGRTGWGIYEYRNGKLSEVGLLPDGSVPPKGALPAATASLVKPSYDPYDPSNPASLDNQVSEDGMRVFFVAGGELYVHEILPDGSERSVLVSESQLPGHAGEPAPDGVVLFKNLTQQEKGSYGSAPSVPTYAYASPDGSHVFFESDDQLTAAAPAGSEAKVYAFDVDSRSLEYLPNVILGGIVTAAQEGSSFVFVNDAETPELERWVAGPEGGTVTPIAQLFGAKYVGPGRLVANDSILVFQTNAAIPGFNNGNGATEQIYRYDIATNGLDCLSCPPAGIRPTGNAYLSAVDQYGDATGHSIAENRVVNDARGVSSDGTRVFFDSPDALVSRDTNSQRDVYEWENGTVFLLSSGTSTQYSLFLDNSESGGDVFFTTTDELVQGDNDRGFDVYDARVPQPGDDVPPAAVPCEGDACQGPPSVAELLGAPPSATFNGAGNAEPGAMSKARQKSSSRAQKPARARRACRKQKSKHKRSACERRMRKRRRTVGATAKHNRGRGK